MIKFVDFVHVPSDRMTGVLGLCLIMTGVLGLCLIMTGVLGLCHIMTGVLGLCTSWQVCWVYATSGIMPSYCLLPVLQPTLILFSVLIWRVYVEIRRWILQIVWCEAVDQHCLDVMTNPGASQYSPLIRRHPLQVWEFFCHRDSSCISESVSFNFTK